MHHIYSHEIKDWVCTMQSSDYTSTINDQTSHNTDDTIHFHGCYWGITSKLQGHYTGVTEVLQGFCTGVLQKCYRVVKGVMQVCFRGVTWVLWGYYKGVTWLFRGIPGVAQGGIGV